MAKTELPFQYQQIAREIKGQILRGEVGPGGRLMSERELGRRFRVQRNTIRQALSLLETEGQISIEGRRGAFVLPPPSVVDDEVLLINIHRGSAPNLVSLVEGFTERAEQGGFRVQRQSTDPLPDSAMNQVPDPDALPAHTAGIVLWPHFPTDADRLRRLNDCFPLVLVDQRVMGVSTDCVRFDDVRGGMLVTQHLIELGHRNIAFLTDEAFAETVKNRWHGYVLAHEEAGIPCEPKLSLLYQLMDAQIFVLTMKHLLADPKTRPTSVVCSNDVVAFSLLAFLHAERVRVPDDIAVTGYGNSIPDYTAAIELTTVDQPFLRVGREAARLLCERARQSTADRLRTPLDIVLPVNLVVRGSTVPS